MASFGIPELHEVELAPDDDVTVVVNPLGSCPTCAGDLLYQRKPKRWACKECGYKFPALDGRPVRRGDQMARTTDETALQDGKWPRTIPFPLTPKPEALRLIQEALRRAPDLTDNGFGVAPAALKLRWQEVAICADWIKQRPTRKTVDLSTSSYGLKHVVERWARTYVDPCDGYVSNGAFIAAALGLGLKFKRCHPTSPNAAFNINSRTHMNRR